MYDRTITRLVEQNCRAYRLFTTPPDQPAPPRTPDTTPAGGDEA